MTTRPSHTAPFIFYRFGSSRVLALSGGVRPGARVDPLAVAVLAELGIDIRDAHAKSVDEVETLCGSRRADLVVTVCDNAAAECPSYRRTKKQVHHAFPDPPALALAAGATGDDALPYYRAVRDEISAFIDTLPSLVPMLGEAPAADAAPLKSPEVVVGEPQAILGSSAADGVEALLGEGTPTVVAAADDQVEEPARISFFERYLSLWVLLCMLFGGLLGAYVPAVADALASVQFAGINAIVAVLLWIMILPMLVQIDFASLKRVTLAPAAVCLTTVVNYLVKPFTMYALALLFFRVVYINAIPDASLRDSYIAGLVLLAGAPCTAMVFVWSALVGGDGAYTLVQVAVNDLLMLGLYIPTAALLIGASGIELPWITIVVAVTLFIAAPLALAATIRWLVVARVGSAAPLDRAVSAFKPVTIAALLAVLILVFIFQGPTIAGRPTHILMVAVPIVFQVCLNFAVAYAVGFAVCIPHARTAPASLIATSNFFELAVAVAISIYGLGSGAALATVVGVLVEVPLMLALVHVCTALRPALDKRCAECPEKCAWSITAGERVAAAVCCGGGSLPTSATTGASAATCAPCTPLVTAPVAASEAAQEVSPA